MSREAAIAFLKKVAEDSSLQQKIVALAKEQGYVFSVEELTEEELGSVTGGALSSSLKLDSSWKLQPALDTTVKLSPDLQLGSLKLSGSF